MKKSLSLFIILLNFVFNSEAQNHFYLTAGNSTIVPCNSTTTSVVYNVNSTTPGPGLYTVTLQPPAGGGVTLGFSANSIGHIFNATTAGIYTMTAYDGSSNLLGVIHFSVTLATVFDPAITAVNDTICTGGNTSLSFTPVTSNYTISPFSWSTSQNTTPISVNPTVTTTYSLNGSLITQDPFSTFTKTCSVVGTKSIVVNSCTGIHESQNAATFKVYPNPASTTLYLDLDGHWNSEVEIIDLSGRVLLTTKLESQLDISSLSNGIYYIKIISEDKRISYSKFMKE